MNNPALVPVLAISSIRIKGVWQLLPIAQSYIAAELRASWINLSADLDKHHLGIGINDRPFGSFPLPLTGLYRSYAQQDSLYGKYQEQENLFLRGKLSTPPSPVADPKKGSYHMIGRAFDFWAAYIRNALHQSWDNLCDILHEHNWAHYPPDGINIEPWHIQHLAPFGSLSEAISSWNKISIDKIPPAP